MCSELVLGDLFSGVTKAAVAACFPSFGLMTSQYGLNEFRMECAFYRLGHSVTELECSFRDAGYTQLHPRHEAAALLDEAEDCPTYGLKISCS